MRAALLQRLTIEPLKEPYCRTLQIEGTRVWNPIIEPLLSCSAGSRMHFGNQVYGSRLLVSGSWLTVRAWGSGPRIQGLYGVKSSRLKFSAQVKILTLGSMPKPVNLLQPFWIPDGTLMQPMRSLFRAEVPPSDGSGGLSHVGVGFATTCCSCCYFLNHIYVGQLLLHILAPARPLSPQSFGLPTGCACPRAAQRVPKLKRSFCPSMRPPRAPQRS